MPHSLRTVFWVVSLTGSSHPPSLCTPHATTHVRLRVLWERRDLDVLRSVVVMTAFSSKWSKNHEKQCTHAHEETLKHELTSAWLFFALGAGSVATQILTYVVWFHMDGMPPSRGRARGVYQVEAGMLLHSSSQQKMTHLQM